MLQEGVKIAGEMVRARIFKGPDEKRRAENERHVEALEKMQSNTSQVAPAVAADIVSRDVPPVTMTARPAVKGPAAPGKLSILLPTKEETVTELKRRLGKELYRAELDLAEGLRIAGKPCDCLDLKHSLGLEAASEELIAQDPANTVYRDIITWINVNRPKLSPAAIASGQYDQEYPLMASEFQQFRKRVFGTLSGQDKPPEDCATCQEVERVMSRFDKMRQAARP